MKSTLFQGIFPPLVTPFKENGDLDLTILKENMVEYNKTRLAGYVVLGSNGEYVYLTKEERRKVIDVVLEGLDKEKRVLAGTGCESLKETVDLSREAEKLGVDGLLVVTPNYYRGGMTEEALRMYYEELAESVQIPVLLYNVPKFTDVNLSPSLVARLAKHPNIVGIKDSSGNIAQLGEIVALTEDEDFSVLVGTASLLFSALGLGAMGGVLALANIAPTEMVEIMEYVEEGEYEKARRLQLTMIPVNRAITATFGIPGLKYAMDSLGYQGGYPRLPLQPLTSKERGAIDEILKKAELL